MSSRGVLVLGMHRSGTSAVARVVNLLGIPLLAGDDLLEPDHMNPRGYWESEALMRFDDELLEAAGGSWSHPPVSPDWGGAAGLRDRARAAFGASFSGEWVWKDPRASVTLPFWLSAFEIEPVVVLVYRDPREVAASLARRDGFSERRSLALWERYVRAALTNAAGLPAFVTGYADLLADPVNWAERVAAFLRAHRFSSVEPQPRAVAGFVDTRLRRSQALDAPLSAEQTVLAERLETLRGGHAALAPGDLGAETPGAEDLLLAEELAGLRARARSLEAERDALLSSRVYRLAGLPRRTARRLRLARRL